MAAIPPYFQAEDFFSITPHDTNTIADQADNPDSGIYKTCSLYVGTAGDVSVVSPSGKTKTFTTTVNGTFLPIVVKQVRSTGTTASNILGLVAKKRNL